MTDAFKTLDLEARRLLGIGYRDLAADERRIIAQILRRSVVARNIVAERDADSSFGQRLADRVAAVGGSWRFIIAFGVILVLWVAGNSVVLSRLGLHPFDPFPYIFLNLVLSMLAALQAPVIMMSQNRQAAKDRQAAEHDYEVNLKAELEILGLHEKVDGLRSQELAGLLAQQLKLLQEVQGAIGITRMNAGEEPQT